MNERNRHVQQSTWFFRIMVLLIILISWIVEVQFQIRDQFWISHQKLHEACYLDFLVLPNNMLVWLVAMFWCFPGSFRHNIGSWAQNLFLLSQNYCTRIACVNLVRANKFFVFFQEICFVLQLGWTSNTSRQKNNLPVNQKGYDKSETINEKASTRRIQIYPNYFLWSLFDLLFL